MRRLEGSVRLFVSGLLICLLMSCQTARQDNAASAAAVTAEPSENPVQESRDAWVPRDRIIDQYAAHCASCHGDNYRGSAIGPSLLVPELAGGNTLEEISRSIANGNAERGMPAWRDSWSADDIRSMAVFMLEQRAEDTGDAGMGAGERLPLPEDTLASQYHGFQLELVSDGLMHTYGLAVLPDHSVLLTEKSVGLTLITADGEQRLISNTPPVYDDSALRGTTWAGNGWFHDVAIHPDYATNGWVYLSYGDRCEQCNAISRETGKAVSMLALARGRIENGRWVDQELIWQTDKMHYQPSLENGLGARIAFDNAGHVFLSVGNMDELYRGVQDRAQPFGKVIRVKDDGRLPDDNPKPSSTKVVDGFWAYGFRTPQGLAYDFAHEQLWLAEHGPRGGDEINRIQRGANYGWPLVSLGLDYDGSPINYGPKLGIEFNPADLRGPDLNWTPSIGLSNLAFYQGAAFPEWQNDMLVATLKQNDLLRIRLSGNNVIEHETLLDGLGRFRDLDIGPSGHIYFLLEHLQGTRLVRLRPAEEE